ncbi:MAG: hypothetical protein U0353_24115 [Sandaracinus sp.]
MRVRPLAVSWLALSCVLVLVAGSPSVSRAEIWCADALWAHEWGVVVFGASGASRTAGPRLPAHFHGPAAPSGPAATGLAVREMRPDGGERALPVLSFATAGMWEPPPIAIELGFAQGEATRWFPEVDARRSLADVTSPASVAEHARLAAARQSLRPHSARPTLGRDPSRQLAWDRLELSLAPRHPLATAGEPWVQRLRDDPRALWVNRTSSQGGESERFVFYEGQTRERPAITIERGPTYATGRRHLVLRNGSRHAVHDVFLVQREGAHVYVLSVPTIPAGATAGYVLEDHEVAAGALRGATRDALRSAIVDARQPSPPTGASWDGPDGCVMQRDPAVPVEQAGGHALFASEADVLLEAWGPRFFDASGTTLVYREDVAQLDEVMPLAIYTDMYHHVELRRLGLALVENVALP